MISNQLGNSDWKVKLVMTKLLTYKLFSKMLSDFSAWLVA